METLFIIGRIIFGLYFIQNGVQHLKNIRATTGYATAKKIPFPKLSVIVTGLLLLIGGAFIAAGYYPRIGVLLLIIFLVPTTMLMHQFWKETDRGARMGEIINFYKNWALIGALCMLLSYPW